MSLITKTEYARRRGVAPTLITRWAKAGRLVLSDNGKLVNAEASDAILEHTLDPARGGKTDRAPAERNEPPPERQRTASSGGDTYSKVRTFREGFNAKTAEANYRKMIGELIERESYNRALAQNLGSALQRLDTISARLGARLAAEIDVRKCQDLIDAEVESIRQEIADNAQAMIDGAGRIRQ